MKADAIAAAGALVLTVFLENMVTVTFASAVQGGVDFCLFSFFEKICDSLFNGVCSVLKLHLRCARKLAKYDGWVTCVLVGTANRRLPSAFRKGTAATAVRWNMDNSPAPLTGAHERCVSRSRSYFSSFDLWYTFAS